MSDEAGPTCALWISEPKLSRLARCRTLLYCEGMLTEEENIRIRARLIKAHARRRKAYAPPPSDPRPPIDPQTKVD